MVTWLLKQGMIKGYLLTIKHGAEMNLKDQAGPIILAKAQSRQEGPAHCSADS